MKLSTIFERQCNSDFNRRAKDSKILVRELKKKVLKNHFSYREINFKDNLYGETVITDCYGHEILRVPMDYHIVLVQRLIKKEGYHLVKRNRERIKEDYFRSTKICI